MAKQGGGGAGKAGRTTVAKPTSLLSACRLVADLAGVSWTRAFPIYRALQQDGPAGPWLPTSRGRSIHPAEPLLVARFLLAIILVDDPHTAYQTMLRYARIVSPREEHYLAKPDPISLEAAVADGFVRAVGHELEMWAPGILTRIDVEFCAGYNLINISWSASEDGLAGRKFYEDPISQFEKRSFVQRSTTVDGDLFIAVSAAVQWSESAEANGGDE